ncbi:MAG: aspartate/glutamate racemase family protein [Pseudomonadota bacterium]|nr:aspartate/glutamate racemase family protein [Pseudomonadota bacterium]
MIGVFDSGHGGLTVLQAFERHLPEQDFLYLGDHGHAPYGSRSPGEIFHLTQKAVDWLFQQGCRLVILACNTASAVALRRLQQEWLPVVDPRRRILGVIVPTVEAVTGVPWKQTVPGENPAGSKLVAAFATPRTVESGAFVREIACRAPQIRVVQQACPNLAARIEASASRDELDALVRGYAKTLLDQTQGQGPDTVLLGCTHYPLVEDLFRKALPPGTAILSQPDLVAESLKEYLRRWPGFGRNNRDRREGHDTSTSLRSRLFTTGDPAAVTRSASHLLGCELVFVAV